MEKDDLVFLIDSAFPYYGGGRETWLASMAPRLLNRYNITIIAWGIYKETDVRTPVNNGKIQIVRMPPFRKALCLFPHYGELAAYLIYSTWTAVSVRKRFGRRKGRVILISLSPGLCYATSALMRKSRHKRIICVMNRWETEQSRLYPPFSWIINRIGRFSYRDCHFIIPISPYDLDYLKEIAKSEDFDKKNRIVPVAGDIGPFLSAEPDCIPPDRKQKVIVLCGTLSVLKGVPELIRAIPYIKTKYNGNFKVIFVGKGDKTQFENLALSLGVPEYVEFTGEKPRLELVRILQESDIAACNFGGGGLPNALLEAMAVGKPIVAWNNLMYTTIVKHGESAHLVEPNDPRALGESIAYLLNNREYAKKLGLRAKDVARKYDVDSMVVKYLSVIDHVWEMNTQ